MQAMTEIQKGWYFMAQQLGADLGSHMASSDVAVNALKNMAIREQNIRIQQINDAIDQMTKNINEHSYKNLDVEQFKGYVAEEWHVGTFNINAIRQGSEHRAWTLKEHGYGSIDAGTNFGKKYSLKYSNTAKNAENMQASLNTDTRTPKYRGQERLIASEQLEEAKKLANERYLKNLKSRPDVAKAHLDTKRHLVGKISDGMGVESDTLSVKNSRRIAKDVKTKQDGFDPEKYGYHKEFRVEEERIMYVNQAIKAGLTAASITAITQIVPEIYKSIDYLAKHGQLDLHEIKESGEKVFFSSSEAFLKGSIAYAVEMAIQYGILGENVKKIDPSIVGIAVTVIYGTIKDSILVAAGRISAQEMGMHFVDTLVISSGYLVSMKIGGCIAQSFFPQLPMIGYAIGSFLGCSVSVVYNISKKKFISFCVDSGFSCFGLVDQNYELPEEVLHEMGIETIPVPRTQIEKVEIARTQVMGTEVKHSDYETIDITVLRRGIIGVNKVGYVLA